MLARPSDAAGSKFKNKKADMEWKPRIVCWTTRQFLLMMAETNAGTAEGCVGSMFFASPAGSCPHEFVSTALEGIRVRVLCAVAVLSTAMAAYNLVSFSERQIPRLFSKSLLRVELATSPSRRPLSGR